MTTTATTLKTALLSLVGASLATDGWEDPVLAEALSQGLADLNAWLPPIEVSFTVTTPGAEQDLSSLAPQQILAVATPWEANSDWRTAAVPWRLTAPGVVMLPEAAIAGQVVRVRYRKLYTVQGLGAVRSHDASAFGRTHPAAGSCCPRVPDPLPPALAAAEHGAERPGLLQGTGRSVSAAV